MGGVGVLRPQDGDIIVLGRCSLPLLDDDYAGNRR
jgi:hypothetical protein